VLINGVPTAVGYTIDGHIAAVRKRSKSKGYEYLVRWVPRVPQNRKEAVSGDMDRPFRRKQQIIYLGDTAGSHPREPVARKRLRVMRYRVER
jgi:hypothetical protein